MNPSFIIFFFLQILVRSVRADVTISADQTASTDVLYSEPVSILKDVKYTVNADTLQFTNGLNNAGTLVFADTVGSDVEQKLVVSNGDFINSGEVDVTCNSITTPSYMFNVANFKNEGTMYFKGTQNAVQYGASQVTLISTTESIVNDGSMTFDGIENAYLKSSGTITNNGKISVQYNSGFAVSQSILGSGSIELGLATTLWFDDPSNTDISGQKVIQTEGSVIVFDTTKLTKPFTVNFGKFGGQNLFAVTTPVTSTSYDSITGILTIKVNGQDISLVLGTNLDPFGFIASPVSNPVTSPLDGQQHQIYTIVYSGVSVPPLPSPETKTITEKGVEHEVVVSYISTTSDNQLVTITTTSTIIPPFPKGTTSLLVENDVTIYDVYSYFIATNDQGAEYTATTILSYSPPAPTTVTIYQNHEHIQEVYSYYITVDGEGKIITESKLVSSTISYDPAPGPETKIVDLGNEVTEYDVISYYTTLDENGKVITTSTVDKFSPPPVSTITIYENHEHIVDVYSYFITVDGDGKIITDSKIISSSISYDPAPGPETKIVDLGNEVTEYDVISYYTTLDENGKVITTSTVDKFSPPPVSTITIYENHEHIVDVYSYFITVDGDGKIITDSKIISSSISYDPAPGPETKIVDLGNEVTEYDVISYYTTLDENGKVITTSTVDKFSPPPVSTITIYENHEHIVDVYSYFITVDGDGKIITDSKIISSSISYDPAPGPETKIVDLGNEVTEYDVISYYTTLDENGKVITTSTTTKYSPPPLTVTATTASDYVESDWISFFITVDEKGDIVTSSTLFNATRDYKLPEAPHTSFGPAPPVETHTVVLENNMTNYEVVSYWTTTNEFGGLITTSSTSTYSAPPLTVTATTASDYVESDWISFFITVDEKGDIVTSSTLFNATRDYKLPEAPHTSFGPAPPVETHTVVLENNMTNYEVVSYWTTTNEFGGLITTSSTSTYSAPPLTVTATTASDYVESDWISFFITVDEKGDIVTSSTLFNATRDYKLPEAPHTSFGPAPPVETHTVVLENNMTNYEVVSYWTTTNEFGGLITTSSTSTYSAPPLTVTATTASDYVESDWISFFITVDEKGDIVTSSTLFNATRDYKLPEAPHTSFGPAPPVETHTVVLENNMTNYEVVSYWTTTNEFGGLITTSSTSTYSAPPLTVTATTASDYVESDWISFFITVDEKGDIVTSSTLFNATRDYKLPEAPHTSFGPAPPVETHTVVLENNMTNYEVVSYWTTTNEFGGLITTSSTSTYSAPPLTVTATTASDYVESDWISFFITVDEKGDIVTSSTLFNATRDYKLPEAPHTSFGPAPPVETHTVVLENNMTNYEVVSYWTTTNEFGGLITTSSTSTYSAPPLTVTATTASDYVESDWISFFITVDEKGDIVTSSTLFNATRDYKLPEAPHTSFGPAPPVETHTVVLENNMTNYEVVSYWTTTNEFGGLITTSSTSTYSAPPLTVTATTASDYVESDWISFFITVDEKGDIVTSSTLFNATRDYKLPEAPHTSFGPAPPVETHTVVLENNMTNYEVVSYWTTTNEFGGLITTSSTSTYSAPPLTVTATTASDYVESDWISFFITVDEKGDIVTSSTLFNATRDYKLPEAPHTSFGPAPPVETHTVVLENNMTNYEVVSYWTTTNEFGGLITTSSTSTYSAPPLTVTATTASDYVESDWISFFITVDEKGDIVTSSTLFNATRDYKLPEAPHTSFGPAPPVETHTVVLENNMTNYEVVSYWTTTNEFGGLITTSSTSTYSAPPLTVTATTASDYVESDWISFFITVDEKGDIVTSSTLFNATRDYKLPEAPHTSFGPAPPVETHTVVLENNMTNYEVVSYWTTTNEFGGLITTSSTSTYSAPPLTVTATTASDYVESDWISFFITVDEKGDIVTSSTLFNATRDYKLPEAPHTSFGPAPPVETHTVVLENNMTNYEVVSYWTTTNEFGGLITTSSTSTYSAPPLTVTATTASDYVESDWISFFITVDEKGDIVTSSTLFNATRDYKLPEAPHTSFGPAPPVETHTVVLENNMTNYEVVSYWTTTNEFGGLITTSSTSTYSAPPLTVTATTASDYVESDWISFFITVDEKGDIVTSSTLFNATRDYKLPEAPHTSFGPAPPVETHTVVLENNMTNYEVVSYWTTTNEFGGLITTSSTSTYSAPPLTVTATTASDYVESDWISFFITVDEKGDIVTSSTLFNATRDYKLPEAPHTSFGPAPPVETHTVVLENNMTNYEVVSYWTTTNEFGGLITTSSTSTYSAPPLTVTATTASDYVESDWISFFITVDEKGDIVTSSTLFNATRDYKLPEAPHTSFGPAPPVETHTVVLENNMTNYEVVSYWTTTNEFGGLITTSSTSTYSAPPLTVTATTASDYVESDWISFFITVDEKGDIVTSSTLFNATRDYKLPEAPHTSFGPAPPVETHTVVLENNMTNYEVVSYWTTTNEFGGLITTSSTSTYSAPPLTVTATTASDYVESDWISFFITVDEKGDIVTSSTLFNATRDYKLPEAPHTSFGPAPPVETHTVVLENNMTNYEVVSYWTTTNEFGGLITTSSTSTYSAPPLTVTATTASDYVESDWISFFITVDEKGDIVTSSTLFNATRDYKLPEAPHTSFGPAPPVETHTVVLENNMTNYEVVSYWTTTNEFGGLITTSSTSTYSAPPLTVTATTASDYVESDWISFFITVDEKGDIVTSSTLFNATRDYKLPEAPHTSFGPAPPVETHTVVLENNMTNYEVVSYWTTTNEFGGLITTSSTSTYSAPPLTVTATTASDYVESDWISFFITVDEKGDIVTSSTLFNATRDYKLPEAPHTSFGPAPPVETHTVVLENNMTNYEVVSYWTTTNEFGGLITTSSTSTYSAPPLTVTATTASDYVESDWISFFITVDEKGDIVTSSTLFNATRDYKLRSSSCYLFGPAPPVETHTVVLENNMTNYEVVSYWTTTNEFGGLITTSSTSTYSAPPLTVTATTASDYVESDWISFFITVDEKGDIVTSSTLFNATRDYKLPEAPHTSFGPAPPVETHTVVLENNMTNYEVVSYWTTTNEFGGLITTSSTSTYSAPPLTVTATTASDYVESDWISFFITVDEKGDIVTSSTLFNATRDYKLPEAPHTSFGPAPPVETHTVVLENNMTNYEVVSYWTTTNEFGGLITTSSTSTYSAPPLTVTATTASDYVESDWISFFITVDEKGDIVTSSTLFNATREYNDAQAVATSFSPAPPVETHTVVLENNMTNYEVVSYWTTTNEFGGLITTSSTSTYSAPPLTVTATTASDYVESDWISFFITVDEKGDIVTSSTLFNATRDYKLPEAPHTSFGPAPPVETHTVVLENNMTNYEVVSYWTTTNEFGGLITTSSTSTYSAPPLTVTATTASDYVESDWISFFITVDEKGDIVTSSTLFNATRDYKLPEAPHTSFGPAPPVETHTVVLENNMTNYEVVSYWTTTNEFGGLITTSSTSTYSAPPLTVTATTASDYVESDWISFFITVDEKGDIVTSSTLFNATRDYKLPEAPHTSFGPAPPVETHTVVLENNMTNYEVVSYWTTTNEFGGLITTSSTSTYSAPPLTVTATTASDYVESDWISFFITVDEKGDIVTSSTLFNATRDYKLPEAPHTSFGPAPPVETHTVVLENNMTNYEVVSYWTTTNEFGGLITTSSTSTYSAPPLTVTATTASDYVESDWISFFITVDEKGDIVTSSTLFNATRDYNDAQAVVSYWTTTNEFGGLITTSSTSTYSAPPLTVTATTASDYVESDWISFFITVDEKGDIVTSSTLFNATRDYKLPEAPHTSFGPAPPVETHTVVLENNMTNYEVVSYWTTTNEFGGLITTSSTSTYSAPPLTVTATTASDYVESDWISFFITVDEKGDIVTSSTLFNATRDYKLPEAPHTSFGPAPPVETHTVVLENNMTNYEVVSYWTTTNEFGGLITTSSTSTYSAPPLTVTATTASDYVESDWISFFITVDEKGDIVTSSTLFNATREYNDAQAVATSFSPAPPVETHTVVLENNMTNYEVVSYWTTTNEFGGLITTSSTSTYSAPPLTVTATTASDYVESDWISFFITVDEKGDIVTSSTLFNATRDYKLPEAPHTSFGPAPPVETHTVVLENNMTNYEVVSYWTTTNEFGGLITTSSTSTYSAPPLTVTATTASDYVESDWISFFITVDEKGDIVTSSTLFNATRDYKLPEAPHTSFGPAPPVETHTVVLENNMTNYEVVSYWTTTNEFGGLITTSSTSTYSAPPLTVTATTASDYVESDWISFFITVDEKGDIVTSSTLFNATRDYKLPEAPHTSFGPAPPVETHTVVLENNMTNYEVVSYWTTTNEFGGLITTSSTSTYSAPPLTVTATTASDYVESDWISFFITVDEKGDIVTSSTLFNATREYNDAQAVATSFSPAPPVETHTVVLENNMTNYEVVSYWTTTNEFGGLITTSSTSTYSAPPLTVTATTASDYVESDWISFFITVDEKGDIVTSSTLFNATRDYKLPEAPHTSFGPAPPVETHTVVLENNMTNYEVVSYWTTTNEFGGLITTSSTSTYSAPPLTVTATTASDYVESDWISFFITVDEKGDIVTSSTLFNATRDYKLPEAPHTSFGPAPPVETHTVVLENNMTNYEVVSYWTTTNEFGGLITTSSTSTYSAPPLTVTATTASDYVESDWISFFITVDEKGDIVTSSTLFNATREYNDAQAVATSFSPAPPVETHTVVLENNMTNYEVVSYWTTTNEFGGLITTSSTSTYSAPPLTVTATTASDYVESDWISFFITVDEKGDIVTSSTLFNATRDYKLPEAPHTSFGPAPPVETHTVVLENNMTNYEVVSYWTTTNEFGGLITTSSTSTYSAPPLTVTATTASDYVESDWISFFITVDEKGDIVTSSTLFNATRDYKLPEAPHTSFGPAPPVETHTVVLENNMTNYEVVSYWTTTNEFGGLITTSSTSTYSAPPLTVTATTASDYVESDWISFFITVDEKGDIVTSSTLFNATREYNDAQAVATSFSPAPPVETHTVVLENNMTNYEVVSYWTTTNEFGGLITTSSTSTYSAPPLTVTATTASDYVESDWISFFITVDEKGDIVTSSTLFNATRDYKLPEAPHTSFGPAPPVETHTVVLENNMTNYEVVSYWTTTNEFGGLITTSSTSTYSAPPLTVTATTASDYVESDWISFFITVDEKGDIVTSSTLFNATRDYKLPEAPYTFLGDHTTVITSGGKPTTVVVSHITTTDSNGHSTVIETTLPVGSGSNDHTTVITSGGKPTTVVVSHITTTDSNGHSTVIETTLPVGSGSNDHTTVITSGGKPTTVVVSHITTTDSNGHSTVIETTLPVGSGSNDHTTVITSGGKPTTVVVSHITTTDSNGHSTVIETTLPVGSGSNDHTTVITSGGKPTTVVVSHITTTDSNGNTVTIQQYPTLGEPSTSNRPTNVAQPQPAAGNSARHSSSSNDLNSSSSSRSTTTLEGNSIIPSASQSIFSGAPGHTNSISDTYKGSASQISMKWGSLSMVLIMLILNI
ncbi:hypothetical protein J6894_04491 [Nakaseomyces glabratus]|nr:hypothetical protein J6894_04491 [Nakaseomyces glabratus]